MRRANHPVRFLITAGLAVLVLAGAMAQPLQALPAPSKTQLDQSLAERADTLAALDAVLGQEEVLDVLAAHGFTREQANLRLAQLSPEELQALSSQIDQLQVAGQMAPMWIWVLVAVLIIIAIVAIAA
jgi:hypothetical protein